MRLIISDRGYFIFLALLPFIMGVLSLSVPGDVGFGVPVPAIRAAKRRTSRGRSWCCSTSAPSSWAPR